MRLHLCRSSFRYQGIWFYFFSNEGNPREPVHIHAGRNNAEAKLWLEPEVRIAESFGYNRQEQGELVRVVEQRRAEIMRAWHEHFGNIGSL